MKKDGFSIWCIHRLSFRLPLLFTNNNLLAPLPFCSHSGKADSQDESFGLLCLTFSRDSKPHFLFKMITHK